MVLGPPNAFRQRRQNRASAGLSVPHWGQRFPASSLAASGSTVGTASAVGSAPGSSGTGAGPPAGTAPSMLAPHAGQVARRRRGGRRTQDTRSYCHRHGGRLPAFSN